jgi:type II secretory ATPase GspE/PulE/Tfp pilus assembly ATPase PilB-like protein
MDLKTILEQQHQQIYDLDGAEKVDEPIVVQFVNRIIRDAIDRGASAIRFTRQPYRLDVQYCIDHQWENVDSVRIAFSGAVLNRLKVMADLDYWRQDLQQTGMIRLSTNDVVYDLTLTVTKGEHGEEHRLDIRRA